MSTTSYPCRSPSISSSLSPSTSPSSSASMSLSLLFISVHSVSHPFDLRDTMSFPNLQFLYVFYLPSPLSGLKSLSLIRGFSYGDRLRSIIDYLVCIPFVSAKILFLPRFGFYLHCQNSDSQCHCLVRCIHSQIALAVEKSSSISVSSAESKPSSPSPNTKCNASAFIAYTAEIRYFLYIDFRTCAVLSPHYSKWKVMW